MIAKFPQLQIALFIIIDSLSEGEAFNANHATVTPRRQTATRLFENLDDLRNNLESSWNVESMGQVPNNPQAAAEEAASSIRQALADGLGNMCFVDLFLPQYDISQGDNTYDELEAVDYCTFLSKYLDSKAVIYVKDAITLQRVNRVLVQREKARLREEMENVSSEVKEMYEYDEVSLMIDEDDPDWENYPDENVLGSDINENQSYSSSQLEFYDDFGEIDSVGDSFISTSSSTSSSSSSPLENDGDFSYRDQLFSAWKDDSDDEDESKQLSKGGKKRTKLIKKLIRRGIDEEKMLDSHLNYRVASFFGDSKISKGGDMTRDVVRAVKKHGLPKGDEETIIILSANSDSEMLAVRALISKYQDDKKFIFVNCRLDPLPLELENCSTVYHLTPILAKRANDPRNVFNQKVSQEEEPPIKIVSIRRYPGDWEVYVDPDGNGFNLAQKAPAFSFPKKGPGNEWIVSVLKSYLSDSS